MLIFLFVVFLKFVLSIFLLNSTLCHVFYMLILPSLPRSFSRVFPSGFQLKVSRGILSTSIHWTWPYHWILFLLFFAVMLVLCPSFLLFLSIFIDNNFFSFADLIVHISAPYSRTLLIRLLKMVRFYFILFFFFFNNISAPWFRL